MHQCSRLWGGNLPTRECQPSSAAGPTTGPILGEKCTNWIICRPFKQRLQLLILVYTHACRCVKSSDKHCNFSVSMLSAQTHRRCQAATALWFDHTTLESSGVRATLSSTALCIRSAIIALAVHDNGLKMPAKQTCVWRTHHIQMTQTGTGRHR